MENLFAVAAIVLVALFTAMVGYTVYASIRTNRNRNTRLNQIQQRLAEIEAEKENRKDD